ncbi:hypothetical protein GCM10023165_31830 [Variovorax defluvii]|uniref:Uncharacterized protein n=1 Tax=Variovorax defluvii TaxID=913761 RepID=A0ABP8HXN2_9BURK
MLAPKGTPKDLVTRISTDIAKAVATPEMRSSLVHLYYRPETAAPEQFAHSIGEDIRRLGEVIRSAGITAE